MRYHFTQRALYGVSGTQSLSSQFYWTHNMRNHNYYDLPIYPPRTEQGTVCMTPFSTKIGKFCPFIYTTTVFWEPKSANIWKRVSNCKFLRTISLSSPCKLWKREFVKTVMSYACILHVQSLGMCMCADVYCFFTKWHFHFLWSGMHNTALLVVFVELNKDHFDNVVVWTWNFSKTQRKNLAAFCWL